MDKCMVYSEDKLVFELYPYSEVHQHVKTINSNTLPYKVLVHLPKVIDTNYVLYQITQILPDTGDVNFEYCVDKKPNHPWLDILSELIDWSIGQHIYKMSFIQRYNNQTCDLYFSYRLQDDHPPKPYDYMSKYREAGV